MAEQEARTNADNEDYDPYEHRSVPLPESNFDSIIHFLKGCIGTGIFAMPEAFKNSGITAGVPFTLFIGFVCTYGFHILMRSQYILCKRLKIPILSYRESMRVALQSGPKCLQGFTHSSPAIVDFFIILYQLGICCVYVVFVSANVKSAIDQYLPNSVDVRIYMVAFSVPYFITMCVRQLKYLVPFSLVANIITLASFGGVMYYCFKHTEEIHQRPHIGSLYTIPLYFGTTMFALEAIGPVIAVESNMKTPADFRRPFGVLNVSMAIIVFFYVAFGYLGYWRFGEKILSSITLNFEETDILAQIIKVLYSVAIFLTCALQAFMPVEILWGTYLERHVTKNKLFFEYVLRFSIVLVTVAAGICIPLLGLFTSLIGAFCLSFLAFIFPATMEMCVLWPDQLGRFKYVLMKDLFIIFFAIFGLLTGCYSNMSEIYRQLKILYS